MPLSIVQVSAKEIRVRIETIAPPQSREWVIDRKRFGSIGAIRAKADNGENITIGNIRTRDGSQMLPAYARLRSLLSAV